MSEWQLAEEVWSKVTKDISLGRLGQPMEVDEVDLSTNLLTDTFGVWECRSAGDYKV